MNINLINKIKKIDSIESNPHAIQYPNAKYSNKSEFCLSILYNNYFIMNHTIISITYKSFL